MHNEIFFPKICSIAPMVKEFIIAHPLTKILGKNILSSREKIPLSKNLKIFHLAQKLREK